VIIREDECNTDQFILISKDEAEVRGEGFDELIFGRVLAADLVDKKDTTILHKGDLIDKENLQIIMDADIEVVKVRSPLTCHTVSGVCQHCFGMDLATRKQVDIGSPIGVVASQSIGEPGTQLTMRTFHS
jgi:DNA-directed RNA polymerase subunit beta'